MIALFWRWSVIGICIALSFVAFGATQSATQRSWLLLVTCAVIPAMVLWVWKVNRPVALGAARRSHRS